LAPGLVFRTETRRNLGCDFTLLDDPPLGSALAARAAASARFLQQEPYE